MERISLARGVPAIDIVPVDAIERAARVAFQNHQEAFSYTDPAGLHGLRSWIADREQTTPDEVLITNGSLQALDFVARTLIRPADRVIVESPTYDYSLAVFRRAGLQLTGIPLEPNGLDVDRLEATLKRDGPPAAVYVIPTFQNPTGVCLSLGKRHRLIQLAQEWGFLVIEDDPYRQLRFDGETVPTLRELWPGGTVVQLTSFTKTIAPGLRCGAAIGPKPQIGLLADAARQTYISPGSIAQAIVHAYCTTGMFDAGLAEIVPQLARRRDALIAALNHHLGHHLRLHRPQGGYFLWARLDQDSQRFAVRARQAGVDIVAGNQFFIKRAPVQAVRLAFASARVDHLEQAAARLATCLDRTQPAHRRTTPAALNPNAPEDSP